MKKQKFSREIQFRNKITGETYTGNTGYPKKVIDGVEFTLVHGKNRPQLIRSESLKVIK